MSSKSTILSNNIRYLRKSLGLNQEQLAESLKIKRSNIAAYEAKNVEPRLRIVLEMAKIFNIDIQTFIQKPLEDGIEYAPFMAVESQSISIKPDINNEVMEDFIEKTAKIKTILNGFKAFYNFRRNKIENLNPSKERAILDIDNFIQLIEHLLNHNEMLIKSLRRTNLDA